MSIPLQQARGIFTEVSIATYKENAPVPSFLRNLFTPQPSTTKYVSIEVQRDTEFIAVDVNRGGEGHRNQFSLSTLKEYMPPLYNENFDATSLDRYDVAFGQPENLVPRTIGMIGRDVGMRLAKLQAKVDRAEELQAGQIFETGIVVLKNGDNIDYKRKAGSLVDPGAGNYWDTVTTGVEAQIVAAGAFIRNEGKVITSELDMICSEKTWIALKKTNYFTNNANFNKVQLLDISRPIKNSTGATYHGQIDAGSYRVNIWTYDETYDIAGGASGNRYISEDQTIFLPATSTNFIMAYGGVPAIIRDVRNAEFPEFIRNVSARSWINNYIDKKGKSHTFELLSAPLAVPVTIDMIYTLKTLT